MRGYIFDQTLQLLIFFTAHFGVATIWGQLLLGSVYLFGKFADINNSWIRYIRVIQWQQLDVSSERSLSISPTVSRENETYRINSPNVTPMTVIGSYLHTYVCAVHRFSHGYYLRVVSIWRNMVCTIWKPLLTWVMIKSIVPSVTIPMLSVTCNSWALYKD